MRYRIVLLLAYAFILLLQACSNNDISWATYTNDSMNWQGLQQALKNQCEHKDFSHDICNSSLNIADIQNNFIIKNSAKTGHITGYVTATLYGSMVKTPKFSIPIYGIATHHKNYSRAQIDNSDNSTFDAPILLYTDDVINLFFAHIQGSSVVILPDNSKKLLHYADNNGHQYYAIGRYFVANNIMQPHEVTWPSIEAYLRHMPIKQAINILHKNPRYIYFELSDYKPTRGTADVDLTANISSAADAAYYNMGDILLLQDITGEFDFMVVQDTGNAIKGKHRFDIYLGEGDKAKQRAGILNKQLPYWHVSSK